MAELSANSEENRFRRLAAGLELEPRNPAGTPPDEKRCQAIKPNGRRCNAWAIKGEPLCAGHEGSSTLAAQAGSRKAADRRRQARESVRQRAAKALDADFDDVLTALRNGLKQPDPAKAAKVAGDYVALVYGRQLQKPEDERLNQADSLEFSSMTREERAKLRAQLLAEHPELAERLRLVS
jgi:hypothetical protein